MAFTEISNNQRVPLFYAEVNSQAANTAASPFRVVLVAPNDAGGTAAAGEVIRIFGTADAIQKTGRGSTLALMASSFFASNPQIECHVFPLTLTDGGAQVITLTLTGAAVKAGTVRFSALGQTAQINVADSETLANVATALAAQINLTPVLNDAFVTAAVGAVVTLTSRAKNLGGSIENLAVRVDTGNTAINNVTARVAGAAAAVSADLSALDTTEFDIIALHDDTAALVTAARAIVNTRWRATDQRYGHLIYSSRGTLTELVAGAATNNSAHESIFGFGGANFFTLSALLTADIVAIAGQSLAADPALPLQTLQINTTADALGARFSNAEREVLLAAGISTLVASNDNSVRLERMVTPYSENALGQADNSFYDANTSFTLAFVLRFLRTRFTSKFARKKLANNNVNFNVNSNVVTPNIIRAELVVAYEELKARALVEDSTFFADNLIVERNAQDPNRVDVMWPGNLVNQLRIVALLAVFRR